MRWMKKFLLGEVKGVQLIGNEGLCVSLVLEGERVFCRWSEHHRQEPTQLKPRGKTYGALG
jgi:hypothetical protein